MTMFHSPNQRLISFLETSDFLHHDFSSGRMDRVVNDEVTLSAIPDEAGAKRWEARTADGEALRLFNLTIESAVAAHPVVIDATEGVYVCYEDEARMQSWCVKVSSH